jgi:hypothetical protein
MSAFCFANRKSLRWLPIVFWVNLVNAQTCMVLSPPTIAANGTVSLDLSLYSARGKEPAAVQWTFQYPASIIQTLTVGDGPALTSAGKTAMCFGDSAAYNCLAVGTNTKTIGNGIIAQLTVVLAPGFTTAPIVVDSPLGASTAGYLISVISRVIPSPGPGVASDCRPQLQRRTPIGR